MRGKSIVIRFKAKAPQSRPFKGKHAPGDVKILGGDPAGGTGREVKPLPRTPAFAARPPPRPRDRSGFRERSSAFDLKAVLDDFGRFIDRQNRAAENAALESQKVAASEGDSEADGGSDVASVVAHTKDLSIAEGQKLHLDLKVGSAEGSARARRQPRDTGNGLGSGGAGGGQFGLLAPPPLPGSTYRGAGVASRTADVDHQSVVPPPSIGAPKEGRAGVEEGLREQGLELDGSGDKGAPPGGSETGVGDEDEGGEEKEEEEDVWGDFESA